MPQPMSSSQINSHQIIRSISVPNINRLRNSNRADNIPPLQHVLVYVLVRSQRLFVNYA